MIKIYKESLQDAIKRKDFTSKELANLDKKYSDKLEEIIKLNKRQKASDLEYCTRDLNYSNQLIVNFQLILKLLTKEVK